MTERKNNTLNRLQDVQLHAYMAQYVESKLNDAEFADKATEALGFKITEDNIRGWRYELGIDANRKQRSDVGKSRHNTLSERIEKVEHNLVEELLRLHERTNDMATAVNNILPRVEKLERTPVIDAKDALAAQDANIRNIEKEHKQFDAILKAHAESIVKLREQDARTAKLVAEHEHHIAGLQKQFAAVLTLLDQTQPGLVGKVLKG